MIAMTKTRILSLLAVTTLFLQSAAGLAETSKPAAKDAALDQLGCRTLLRIGGDERAFTLMYLHGFVSGKNSQMYLDVQTLAEVTDQVIEHCIDHPADKLLPVFEKYRKGK
jgi:hypothetical protein